MTKEQVIAMAREAGCPDPMVFAVSYTRFAALVRNAALEEAAQKCRDATASIWDYHDDMRKEIGTTVCNNLAASIESLKEPTP